MRISDRDYNLGLVIICCLMVQWSVHRFQHDTTLGDSIAIFIMVWVLSSSTMKGIKE